MKVRSKRSGPYSEGEINKLIDSLCHPLSKSNPSIILLDGILHGLVERDPPLSVRKFLKHNIPMLVEGIGRTHGGEYLKAARYFSKTYRSSVKLFESLSRRRKAQMRL